MARQAEIEERSGGFKGEKKYGAAGNMPSRLAPGDSPSGSRPPGAPTRIRKPSLDEMGPGTDRPVPARSSPSPRPLRGEDHGGAVQASRGEGQQQSPAPAAAPHPAFAPHPNPLPVRANERDGERGITPVDPRTKAGAFGEKIRGPHKPTLDEMGPHAMLPVKKTDTPLPSKPKISTSQHGVGPAGSDPKQLPSRTIEIDDPGAAKTRRGRTKKTGRPGR